MLNILINAYAVNPHWGSEPGMGWHWIVNIARYCNVYVITEGEWREEIEAEVAKLPYRGNIRFFYLPVSDKVRRMCWNQGDWRFYGYYRKWQEQALAVAREIIADHHIDIIHQLNMIGFREPGSLWKIDGIPFVWGPV
ncbi:MAG: glycosyltransferase family 1 protein, partial [Muribaculum sp.]|nr:glycosyltransferase family 1 protein [Muribaculum sp.]